MRATTANITTFPARKSRTAKRPAAPKGISRQQQGAAIGVAIITMVLMGLSLAHLAHGIAMVSNSSFAEAWALAIGIDLGFVACELAPLCAGSAKARATVAAYSRPTVICTVMISAALNATAFGGQAAGWMIYPAAGLGITIPAMIYALSRIAFGLAASR